MIELITTSFFVFSSIYGGPTGAVADNQAATSPEPTIAKEATTTTNLPTGQAGIPTNEGIKAKAIAYFKNTPILADIAGCESRFRQYDKNGKVLIGEVNKGDIGVMQINKYYHADKAESLGYDLNTAEGNMAYAKYLYEKEGTKPWNSSSACWKGGDTQSSSTDQVAMR